MTNDESLRHSCQTLEIDFGVDISQSLTLSGDALQDWFYQAEQKIFDGYFKNTESSHDDFQDTITPEQAEAYYKSEEYFDREWSEYEESDNYGKW